MSRATRRRPRLRILSSHEQPEVREAIGQQRVFGLGFSFASSLNDLMYITAAPALVGGVCSLVLIRSKDFVKREGTGRATSDVRDSPASPQVSRRAQ
jgi:hypothetical protein